MGKNTQKITHKIVHFATETKLGALWIEALHSAPTFKRKVKLNIFATGWLLI